MRTIAPATPIMIRRRRATAGVISRSMAGFSGSLRTADSALLYFAGPQPILHLHNTRAAQRLRPEDPKKCSTMAFAAPSTHCERIARKALCQNPPKDMPSQCGRWPLYAAFLLLAGYLLFSHGCHKDEDCELLLRSARPMESSRMRADG